jgi:hypothetical protein
MVWPDGSGTGTMNSGCAFIVAAPGAAPRAIVPGQLEIRRVPSIRRALCPTGQAIAVICLNFCREVSVIAGSGFCGSEYPSSPSLWITS